MLTHAHTHTKSTGIWIGGTDTGLSVVEFFISLYWTYSTCLYPDPADGRYDSVWPVSLPLRGNSAISFSLSLCLYLFFSKSLFSTVALNCICVKPEYFSFSGPVKIKIHDMVSAKINDHKKQLFSSLFEIRSPVRQRMMIMIRFAFVACPERNNWAKVLAPLLFQCLLSPVPSVRSLVLRPQREMDGQPHLKPS